MLYEENVYYAEHVVVGRKYDSDLKKGRAWCQTCNILFDYSLEKNTRRDKLGIRVYCPNDKEKKGRWHISSRNSRTKRRIKQDLFRKYGDKCFYCKKTLVISCATIEHLIPLSEGGTWHIKNLRIACVCCNNLRGNKPVWVFIEEMGF